MDNQIKEDYRYINSFFDENDKCLFRLIKNNRDNRRRLAELSIVYTGNVISFCCLSKIESQLKNIRSIINSYLY